MNQAWPVRIAKIAGAVALGFVVLLLAGALFVQTPPGEAVVGSAVEEAVSSQIRGRMVIGRVEDVSWDGSLRAGNARIIGLKGGKVLAAQRLHVQPAIGALLTGKIYLKHAQWQGGGFQIEEVPEGNTGIERAFKSPKKAEKDKGPSPLAGRLDLRNIRFEGLTGLFQLKSVPTIRLQDVTGMARVWLDDKGLIRVRIDDATAQWAEPSPLGMKGELRELRGTVHGGVRKVVDLRFVAALGDGTFDVRLRYYNLPEGPRLKLETHGDGLSATALGALGLNLVSEFVAPLDMEISLSRKDDKLTRSHTVRDSEGNVVESRWQSPSKKSEDKNATGEGP